MANYVNGIDKDDPSNKYAFEEISQKSEEEFFLLLEEHNNYIEEKYSLLNENDFPHLTTIEEIRA